jgi:hypothetical protein
MRGLIKLVVSIMLFTALFSFLPSATSNACISDYVIWFKSKKSDTPLFRFMAGRKPGYEKAGYIDQTGKIVIPAQFRTYGNYGGDFFAGLAMVEMDKESQLIDQHGKIFSRPEYSFIGEFSDGLAKARLKENEQAVFINRDGEIAFFNTFKRTGNFSEGLASVIVEDKVGYIDKSGKIIIPPGFLKGWNFSDGVARVIEDGPCTFRNNNPCVRFMALPDAGNFSPEEMRSLPGCQYLFIDKQGKLLTEKKFADAEDFSEGLAAIKEGEKWGYINKSGNLVIPPQFENAGPFSEGLARVQINELVGFIDSTGNFVIPPTFVFAYDFSEGFAVVSNKWGEKNWFIDKTGKQVFAETYDAASSFVMGLAHVRIGKEYKSPRWSYIDRTGKTVFSYGAQKKRRSK